MAIYLSIMASFFTALANIFLKKLVNNNSPKELLSINFLLTFLTLLIFSPVYLYINTSSFGLFLFCLVIFFATLTNYFYFTSVEKNEVSTATIFISLSPIFTLLFATLIGDIISLKTLISVLGITVSVFILNTKQSVSNTLKNIFKKRNYLSILTALFWGAEIVVVKLLLDSHMFNIPTFYLFRSIFLFMTFSLIFGTNLKIIKNPKIVFPLWQRILIVIVQLLFYYYALSIGNVVIVATLVNTYPVFVLIMSYFLFKEKITLQKSAAIISILFFITFLNYYS